MCMQGLRRVKAAAERCAEGKEDIVGGGGGVTIPMVDGKQVEFIRENCVEEIEVLRVLYLTPAYRHRHARTRKHQHAHTHTHRHAHTHT